MRYILAFPKSTCLSPGVGRRDTWASVTNERLEGSTVKPCATYCMSCCATAGSFRWIPALMGSGSLAITVGLFLMLCSSALASIPAGSPAAPAAACGCCALVAFLSRTRSCSTTPLDARELLQESAILVNNHSDLVVSAADNFNVV